MDGSAIHQARFLADCWCYGERFDEALALLETRAGEKDVRGYLRGLPDQLRHRPLAPDVVDEVAARIEAILSSVPENADAR